LRQEACKTERHHGVPRHVLAARRRAEVEGTEITGAGIQAWLDYEEECFSHGVDADLSFPELEELVEGSCVVVSWEEHRRVLSTGGSRPLLRAGAPHHGKREHKHSYDNYGHGPDGAFYLNSNPRSRSSSIRQLQVHEHDRSTPAHLSERLPLFYILGEILGGACEKRRQRSSRG
jgi:hypothetical protein